MKRRLFTNFQKENSPASAGIAAGLIVFFIVLLGVYLQIKIMAQENYITAVQDLSIVRSKLESDFNSRLLLAKGLVSYVKVNPDIQPAEFQTFAANLIGQDPLVRNVTLIKNTTIIYAYPLAGNQAAIGLDLSKIDDQRESLLKAISSQKPVITGIVQLVQGGQGFIFRIPVFIASDTAGSAAEEYWGQASMVLDADKLFADAGFTNKNSLRNMALRNILTPGHPGEMIYGDPATFQSQPVSTEVLFPDGTWQLAALPATQNPFLTPKIILLFIAGILISLLTGWFISYLVYLKNILRLMAYSDSLTKLPNRVTLNAFLAKQKNIPPQDETRVGILMIDINRFKDVNDQFGHHVGDQLLKLFAERLMLTVRASDTIVRLGGDEFLLLMTGVKSRDDVAIMVEKIHRLCDDPFLIGGLSISISSAIGYALFPDDGSDMDTVIKKADANMYQNKA